MTTAPYGSWTSPITAADLAADSHPVSGGSFAGDELWWLEQRPTEGGRLAVRRRGASGEPEDVLPAPWNARSRVHEYGGGAWTVVQGSDRPELVFVEFTDQRMYRLTPGGEPTSLTPADGGMRFGELSVVGDEVMSVRERHDPGGLSRDICAVPLDGTAAEDASRIRSIVSGSHFLAYPRLSPNGRRLAWIAWEHPQMPWDGTELRVADLDAEGRCGPWRALIGSTTESVLQPEWRDDETLYLASDRTGWWNLYRLPLNGDGDGTLEPLHPLEAEFAGPLWTLGTMWYLLLDDGRLLVRQTFGNDKLGVLDPDTGDLTDPHTPLTAVSLGAARGNQVLVVGGNANLARGLRILNLVTGALEDVRLSTDGLPHADFLPDAQPMTFTGGREVHAFAYPPKNPNFTAPEGELPPYVAFVHGGPTTQVNAGLSLTFAYFTSRGIGVIDVNYGGSTGYGRAYRERLKGQWGIVDVEDTVAAVLGLADAGLADRSRLAIRGGSAGGWTVLAALTGSDVFACGASYYGIAELSQFAKDTHDFESRYLDGLIGPLPEAAVLYEQRAPVNRVDELSCPVLLLQGLDDPIVPPSQAEMFRDALLRKGLPHAYLTYQGESHGFRRAETIINATESELSFYGQVMGFSTPGVPALKLWRPSD